MKNKVTEKQKYGSQTLHHVQIMKSEIHKLAKQTVGQPYRVIELSALRKFLYANKIHPVVFYRFVYAKALTKIGRGKYKLNDSFTIRTAENILVQGDKVLSAMTLAKQLRTSTKTALPTIKQTPITKVATTMPTRIEKAIAYLKANGYKVLKPVQEFQEV